ncbi:MAG: 4Fe-4S dicluster domain-containing protein [Tenericutes bacterium]|nr:4Fe-4S dicluster domain-containing protein [Mycoplasmatota bacterium]
MSQDYISKIKDAGIVGAGGAGFPTHVKLDSKAEVVIINGAECEPLLRVDQQMMEFYSKEVIDGLRIAMIQTGAKKGVICLKGKYKKAISNLQNLLKDESSMELKIIKDYYPAGDEQQLVYEVTGKVVPLMGIPLDVEAVVINVLTTIHIARDKPVTERVITVTGAVEKPQTFIAPVGTTFGELIKACSGPANLNDYSLIVGGPMMGYVEENWNAPVTKLTGGIIILPKNHSLIIKKTRKTVVDLQLTKAICCQCSYCTDMCPRNIIGLNTEPHKVMRGLANEDPSALGAISSVVSCCNCGLCTLYACPMDLDPGKITNMVKQSLLKKGAKTEKIIPYEVDPLRESKKVPTKRLIARIELSDYDVAAPLIHSIFETRNVKIMLKQHIGVSATSIVRVGEPVTKGTLIASCGDNLGANIHASISGKVINLTDDYIEIQA